MNSWDDRQEPKALYIENNFYRELLRIIKYKICHIFSKFLTVRQTAASHPSPPTDLQQALLVARGTLGG
jgi:hypothetical protein